MKPINRYLFYLHLFIGISALGGGLVAILDPWEPAGIPAESLVNSPFENFYIPGIILFTVIGLGNIFAAITLRLNSPYRGYISSIFSWALMIWIVVQCIMLRVVAALHVIFFMLGLTGALIAILIVYEQNQFPANLVFRKRPGRNHKNKLKA